MIRSYLTIAFRNLRKNKVFSLITILGLSAGFTCCLLITLYVRHELSYDTFHDKADRIVRVVMEHKMGAESNRVAVTGTKVAPALKRTFPEVEAGVRLFRVPIVVRYQNQLFDEKRFLYADSTFFGIFSYGLVQGNPRTVLNGPDKVVLTESTARKYFGATDPMGKIIQINNDKEYMVTGIVQDAPDNSQIKFDFIASFSSLPVAQEPENWWSANYFTYLLLKDAQSVSSLQNKIAGYMKLQSGETGMTGSNYLTYFLEPLLSVHLYTTQTGFALEPNSNITYIYIFIAIVFLILGIACVNYINLTTARSVERAREVGMRKVLGAFRYQLFWQFIGESVIITSVALVLSILFTLLLPAFNQLADKRIVFHPLDQPVTLLILVASGIAISVLAGSYPAMVLSNFQPIKVLKGNYKTSGSGLWLRKSLIVVQFVISIFLIVATFVIQRQLSFIQNKALGYDKDHVLVLPSDPRIWQNISPLKTELKNIAGVKEVTKAYETPTFIQGGYNMRRPDMPENQSISVTAIPVDEDFIQTLSLQIIAGTDFTKANMAEARRDTTKRGIFFILNESAVKALGWKTDEAVGKRMVFNAEGEVKAVVKDFHFSSMHTQIKPLVIFLEDSWWGVIMVKLSGQHLPQTMDQIQAKWKTIAPHRPFAYHFLDEEFDKMYSSELRTGQVFTLFAGLAILLACLGLFGLAAYTAAQRTKEIGIRKVLGASVASLMGLLSKDFLILVGIAFLITTPIAAYVMHQWLQDFAYRIELSWWIFVLAGVLSLLIALLTVCFQALKVALANPVKSLRSE